MSTRIQIIDGNTDHLNTLSSTLLMYGYNVACYADGQKGYDDYFQYQPHLLIVEPVLDGCAFRGWELAFNILKDDPKIRPYMVALANTFNRTSKALCEETGFDEYWKKPIDLADLLTWVGKAKDRAAITQ